MDFFKVVGIGTVALLGGIVAFCIYDMCVEEHFHLGTVCGAAAAKSGMQTSASSDTKTQQNEETKPETSASSTN